MAGTALPRGPRPGHLGTGAAWGPEPGARPASYAGPPPARARHRPADPWGGGAPCAGGRRGWSRAAGGGPGDAGDLSLPRPRGAWQGWAGRVSRVLRGVAAGSHTPPQPVIDLGAPRPEE